MTSTIPCRRLILTVLVLCATSAVARAQSYKVESAATAAPQEVSAAVRDELSSSAIHVSGPAGALCEIWLRKSIPPPATPSTALGISFGQIEEGTLVGAIRFDLKNADYREQTIQPGVYTMRYMLQPVDGNHQGVSPFRDYLLLSPAALDTSPAKISTDDLLKMSRKASGTGHPSIWSLLPADTAPAAIPGIVHQDDGDIWVVFFQAPFAKPAPMGLVIVGHAPEM